VEAELKRLGEADAVLLKECSALTRQESPAAFRRLAQIATTASSGDIRRRAIETLRAKADRVITALQLRLWDGGDGGRPILLAMFEFPDGTEPGSNRTFAPVLTAAACGSPVDLFRATAALGKADSQAAPRLLPILGLRGAWRTHC
jgi:hypothetical protein